MTDPTTTELAPPTLVLGVGASAGGLDACRQLLAHVPSRSGLAIIVVLHLDPTRSSQLASILEARSTLPVLQVTQAMPLERDHVYVIAPNTSLELQDGEIRPGPPTEHIGHRMAIDVMFASLARAHAERAVAVVLSGLGQDGSAGLAEIKGMGGLCIAQEPHTAQHDTMPRSAIATGMVDAILPPEAIAAFVVAHARVLGTPLPRQAPAGAMEPKQQAEIARSPGFEGILELLARHHGLDPRSYKEGTLRRRAARRLGHMAFSGWQAYSYYLDGHPDELEALYKDVLVGVTQFFRDPEQWAYLEHEVIPRLLDDHDDEQGPVRVWSAGCATGEEAYSLAMIFLEQLEARKSPTRLQIFATDVSNDALAFARRGLYPANIAASISPERLARFFTEQGESYQIGQRVRDTVTLARHDLLTEPPFCRIDLVSCRNLFIYLEPHAQQTCIQRFHFALRPRGVLWIGNSESINGQTELFTTLLSKYRLYQRLEVHRHGTMPWNIRSPSANMPPLPPAIRPATMHAARNASRITRSIESFLLERYTAASVVINQAGHVLHLFGSTGKYLTQPTGEVRLDLLSWVQPSLYAKLRPALKEAVEQQITVHVGNARIQRDSETVRVECTIEPLSSIAEGLFLVTFHDEPTRSPSAPEATPPAAVEAPEEPLTQQLTLQLQEAQAELRDALEELDNANEEYRANYEELVSLNEELQSSNEELETTKEEAQSINEELLTVNRELEERNASLHTVNADLENLLEVTTIPTIFLDRQLRVRRFTPSAERVMWLIPSDVGRPLDHVKRRVDDEALATDVIKVLEQLAPREAEVRCEDGRWYLRRVVPFRSGDRIEGVCLTYYDITSQRLATEQSEEARYFAEAIVRSSRLPFVVLDHELSVVSANAKFYTTFALDGEQAKGQSIRGLGGGQWNIPALLTMLERVVRDKLDVQDFEIEHTFEGLGRRNLQLNASLMERPGQMPVVLLSIEDVTQLREAQSIAEHRTLELEREHRRKDEFLAMLGHELRNPLAALANGLALIAQEGVDPAQLRAIHPMLVRQTTRMTTMLDQLLDISRVISGKIELADEPVDLVDVITAAVEAVTPMVQVAGHRLELSLPPVGTLLVRGDLVRLIQVMENLLCNAVKYTENQGTIWLTVESENHMARISVRDTGVGIDAELLQHIFGVFTQGSQSLGRAKGGLGLGLPLVRLLVGMHGGRVDAFSEGPGRGSEFVVHLPCLEHVSEVAEEEHAASQPSPARRRVLVVDDEKDTTESLATLLEIYGHDVRTANDGRTAVQVARAFQPELVLLDLGLPDIDGYEVATQMRAQEQLDRQRPRARLIAVTGYQRDAERMQQSGFDDHLIKPLDQKRLAALLDELGLPPPPEESPEL